MTDVVAMLFDLDDVIRCWDNHQTPKIERLMGLREGIIEEVAFEPARLRKVVTGAVTKAEWLAEVAAVIAAPTAVERWADRRTWFDRQITDLALRIAGNATVSLATNGTNELSEELRDFPLDHFTYVFNSAEMGVAKPAAEFFEHIVGVLDVSPAAVAFVDDRAENVVAAQTLGIRSHHFRGPERLTDWIKEIGLL